MPKFRQRPKGQQIEKEPGIDDLDLNDDMFSLDETLDPGKNNVQDVLETRLIPCAKKVATKSQKVELLKIERLEKLSNIFTEKPTQGNSYHVVSNGSFDFWTFIPLMLKFVKRIDHLYCSTWIMNRENTTELIKLFDAGKIKKINFLSGIYFKRRETAVYTYLLKSLLKRGQRFIASRNHAKIVLMHIKSSGDYITAEGSANLTGNPQLEQFVINNNKQIYDFHKAWMDSLFKLDRNEAKWGEIKNLFSS